MIFSDAEIERKKKSIVFLEDLLAHEDRMDVRETLEEMVNATRAAIGTINAVNERKDEPLACLVMRALN